jgi:hypothetical protein
MPEEKKSQIETAIKRL